MKINGVEFDEPVPKGFPRYLYSEREEGKRLKIQEIWVDSYIKEGTAWSYAAHSITLSNYGAVTFDGKPVRDPKEIDWVKKFFKEMEFKK